jgi:hypothetical protein
VKSEEEKIQLPVASCQHNPKRMDSTSSVRSAKKPETIEDRELPVSRWSIAVRGDGSEIDFLRCHGRSAVVYDGTKNPCELCDCLRARRNNCQYCV